MKESLLKTSMELDREKRKVGWKLTEQEEENHVCKRYVATPFEL